MTQIVPGAPGTEFIHNVAQPRDSVVLRDVGEHQGPKVLDSRVRLRR